jgi:Domain of unknown function (DUF5617)
MSKSEDKEQFFSALSTLSLDKNCLKAYKRLWTDPIKANPEENVDSLLLKKAVAILDDYTKSDSGLKRAAFFHWNRHHCQAVGDIVRQVKSGTINNIEALQDKIFEVMQKSKSLNLRGSLVRRLGFIIQKM